MIKLPEVLALFVLETIPNSRCLPGNGAIIIMNSIRGLKSYFLMFKIDGCTITTPTWVGDVFRTHYDLANQQDLNEFILNLKTATM